MKHASVRNEATAKEKRRKIVAPSNQCTENRIYFTSTIILIEIISAFRTVETTDESEIQMNVLTLV